MNKIVLIGGGKVGVTILYTLLLEPNLNLDLVLIDNKKQQSLGNIEDLSHVIRDDTKKLKLGTYADLADADIVIIAAGVKPHKNRNFFLKESYLMIKNIMDQLKRTPFKGFIIVVSNPNDVLTSYVAKNYLARKVIGTGTYLDTMRLKSYLAFKYHFSPDEIEAFVYGEHGPEQFIDFSNLKVKNQKLTIPTAEKEEISDYVKNIAALIVKNKGYTNFGIARSVLDIIKILLTNSSSPLVVSSYNLASDIAFGHKIKLTNYEVQELPLSQEYQAHFQKSIAKIKKEFMKLECKGIIGIDLDDTLTNLQPYMLEEAYRYDALIHGKGIIDDSKYLVGEKFGWSVKEKEEFFLKYRHLAIEKATVRKNARKVLQKLMALGYQVIIITARSKKYYDDPYEYTKNWLIKNKIPYTKLIVDSSNKLDICLREKVSIFIDDMPSNCLEIKNNSKIKVYMMDNGNNYAKDVPKIKDYLELYEVIIDGK